MKNKPTRGGARKGSGRKAGVRTAPPCAILNIRLSAGDKARLKRYAADTGRTVTAVIEAHIADLPTALPGQAAGGLPG